MQQQVKNNLLLKIFLSALISSILIIFIFYKYEDITMKNNIQKIKEETFFGINKGYELLKDDMNNIEIDMKKLNKITNLNGKDINTYIRNIIRYRYMKFRKPVDIYTLEKTEKELNYDEQALTVLNKNSFIRPIIKEDTKDLLRIEIYVPIIYNENMVGSTKTIYSYYDIENFLKTSGYKEKLINQIVNSNGDIIFGDDIFLDKSITDILNMGKIKGEIGKKDVMQKIGDKEEFVIYLLQSNKTKYIFFKPLINGYYNLAIIDGNMIDNTLKHTNILGTKMLILIAIIISIQMLYLVFLIFRQNKKMTEFNVKKQKELEEVVNNVSGGVIKMICDEDLTVISANDKFFNLIEYTEEEFNKYFDYKLSKLFEVEDTNKILSVISKCSSFGSDINFKHSLIKKSGDLLYVTFNGKLSYEKNGVKVYQCFIIDYSEQKAVSEDLQIEKERYNIISQISDEVMFEYNIEKDILKVSYKYKNLFQVKIPEKASLAKMLKNGDIPQEDFKKLIEDAKILKNGGYAIKNEIRIKNIYGGFNWAYYQGIGIVSNNGTIKSVVGKITNVDKFKKEIEELREKSIRDPLTKVYNKVAIENMIEDAFIEQPNNVCAIFLIDIDNFKKVNDTFGHIFGDVVLKEITANILRVFNKKEIIGRIGGDEFIVFLKDVDKNEYIHQKAQMLCNMFRKSYDIQGENYKISASVGISIYKDDGATYKELLQKADVAVYYAKSEGKDRYKMYEEHMKDISLLQIQSSRENSKLHKNIMHKVNYDNIILDIIELFLQVKDTSTTIKLIIETFSEKYHIDRTYIMQISDINHKLYNTYEWCANGIKSKKMLTQAIDFDRNEYLKIYKGETYVYIDDFENLQDESILCYTQDRDNVKAFFMSYFMDKDDIKGYVGFEIYDKENGKLCEDGVENTFIISRLIGSQMLKEIINQKFEAEIELNKVIAKNEQLYIYIIKKDTYEVLYFNDKSKEMISEIKCGAVCYQKRGYEKPCYDCPINAKNNKCKYFCEVTQTWISSTADEIKWIEDAECYLICSRSISEYVEQIEYIDELTGIPSNKKFKVQADTIFRNSYNIKNSKLVLIYIDIYKFKNINENFGYTCGDEVLKKAGMIIGDLCRKGEIYCRLNEDKFLCLMQYKDDKDLSSRLKELDNKFTKIKSDEYKELKVIINCGIYRVKPNDTIVTVAIDKANTAKKTLNSIYENSFTEYNDKIEENILREKDIESKMELALKNNEFKAYLQPKFNTFTMEVCGAEALVRWKREVMIYPNDFIPIFEKNGFIVALDLYMYEEVFKYLKNCIDNNYKLIPISLNVSRVQFSNKNFKKSILALNDKYKIPVELIEFEITENIFEGEFNYIKDMIGFLRNEGFKVSIDDFGSAYSSLNLLKDLNVDVIKLDKGFFKVDKKDEFSDKVKTIIQSMIKMTKNLGMKIVCEGIETQEQLEFLKNANCTIGQGYLFSKPIPMKEFEDKYLKNN